MENFKTGEIVGINVHALYHSFGQRLTHTGITVTGKQGNDHFPLDYWYDLTFHNGDLACMDGEECRIGNVDKYGNVTFINENGDTDACFTLSPAEAKIAVYSQEGGKSE